MIPEYSNDGSFLLLYKNPINNDAIIEKESGINQGLISNGSRVFGKSYVVLMIRAGNTTEIRLIPTIIKEIMKIIYEIELLIKV